LDRARHAVALARLPIIGVAVLDAADLGRQTAVLAV
jgi:hypothetical protein